MATFEEDLTITLHKEQHVRNKHYESMDGAIECPTILPLYCFLKASNVVLW